jgi:quercetin dioxygenase-like cupin family protein
MTHPNRRTRLALAFAAAVVVTAGLAEAQAPGIKRTVLQKSDVTADREVVMAMAEIAGGGSTGRHTHPGVEVGYALEGSGKLEVAGQPTRTVKAGDSWLIPAGVVHNAIADAGGYKVIANYIVEKGKPLSSPAP